MTVCLCLPSSARVDGGRIAMEEVGCTVVVERGVGDVMDFVGWGRNHMEVEVGSMVAVVGMAGVAAVVSLSTPTSGNGFHNLDEASLLSLPPNPLRKAQSLWLLVPHISLSNRETILRLDGVVLPLPSLDLDQTVSPIVSNPNPS